MSTLKDLNRLLATRQNKLKELDAEILKHQNVRQNLQDTLAELNLQYSTLKIDDPLERAEKEQYLQSEISKYQRALELIKTEINDLIDKRSELLAEIDETNQEIEWYSTYYPLIHKYAHEFGQEKLERHREQIKTACKLLGTEYVEQTWSDMPEFRKWLKARIKLEKPLLALLEAQKIFLEARSSLEDSRADLSVLGLEFGRVQNLQFLLKFGENGFEQYLKDTGYNSRKF